MTTTKTRSKSSTSGAAKTRRTKTKVHRVVVSKKGRNSFHIRGISRARLVKMLHSTVGKDRVEVVDESDEIVDIRDTDFYRRMNEHMTPGKYLRVYREREGWSQSELGERLGGLERQNVSRLERDKRGISKEMAKRLAKLFHVSVDRFI